MSTTVLAAGASLTDLFTHPFLRHAFLAGTVIALAAGLVGYFLVLRAQVFTTDALGHVAFTGALGALAVGASGRVGLFVATVVVAAGMAGLGPRARADDVVIGSTFAWILGLGSFFLTLYTTNRSAGNGTAGVNYLFGSIFGLSAADAVIAAAVAGGAAVLLLLIARPLLFASLDEAVAAARGVPVRLLGVGFLVIVGVVAAQATQAVGALLILGLISAPAGAANQLTGRPYLALGLSAAVATGSMWLGLTVSYVAPSLPPSFCILAVATLAYLLAGAANAYRSSTLPRDSPAGLS
jgi:zinc/manganese transport system permease protein